MVACWGLVSFFPMPDLLIDKLLATVSRRRRFQAVFEGLTSGLYYGALVAAGLLVWRLFGAGQAIPIWSFPVLAALGTLLGGACGLLRPLDAKETASNVDTRYRLKDRFLTALQLLCCPSVSPMERLQLEDTAKHALQVDPLEVAPFRQPRRLVRALATVLLATLFCLFPTFGNRADTSEATPSEEVLVVIEQINEELIEKVEELIRQNPDEKELPPLLEELKQLAEHLENNVADPKEALATLSQMETRLSKAINEFNLEAVDASMQEIADSLASAEAMRSAAQALKGKNYAKAANELEKADFANMTRPERNAVATQLKQNAAAAGLRKLDNLSKLLENMAEKVAEGDASECNASACELAGLCRTQGLRKGICQGLESKLALLGMCKSQCAQACQGQNGGDSASRSNQSSNNWGTGSDGRPQDGKATDAEGSFQHEQITGIHGVGPSEIETVSSDEISHTTTNRAYNDAYRDFRKISEEVLESEPIPLGQRQMIRNYFERIRPKDN